MILNLEEAISKKSLGKLIGALNNLESKEKLFVYLCSDGGGVAQADAMIHIINNNADLIELVGYGKICSAAFDVFFKSIANKHLLRGTIGMCHMSTVQIDINEMVQPNERIDVALKTWMKNEKEYTLKFCSDLGMTVREANDIKRGKEVWFQYPRMKELLNNQQ